MNHPNRPQQPSVIPGVPPPPPKLNTKRLWITLLAPPIAMVLVMVTMFFSQGSFGGDELFITVTCGLACLTALVCWGFYIHTLVQRFRGSSLVLLILAYPIVQGVLLFAIFFGGCLAIISIQGY